MKEKIKILITVIITGLVVSIFWYSAVENLKQPKIDESVKEQILSEEAKEQILVVEYFLTEVEKNMGACKNYRGYWLLERAGLLKEEKEAQKESLQKCASDDFIKQIRLFVAEPELLRVKENLLAAANLVDEFSILVIVYPEEYAKKANSLERQFLEAVTKTREEILKIKRAYNLEQ